MTKEIKKFIGELAKDYGIPKEELQSQVDIFSKPVEVADETKGLLPSSRSTVLVPDETFPVGKARVKELGVPDSPAGYTFKSLSNSKKAIKIAKELGYGPGDIIPPEVITQYPDLEKALVGGREYIENELKAGSIFPKPDKAESFDKYYRRVKGQFPSGTSMVALMNESAKQYQLKFPEFKAGPKLLELINEGTIPFDLEGEIQRGYKIPDPKNPGTKKIITDLLEKNKGYITVANSIDPYIDELVLNLPQDDFDKFAVDLRNQIDPATEKPYTKKKIKTLVANRLKFAVAQYYNQKLTPEIIGEVYNSLRGSTASASAKTMAANKFKEIGPKKIAAFTSAIMGIVNLGQASELLQAGSKYTLGPVLGAGLEILFPTEAEAATIYDLDTTEADLGRRKIEKKFGIETLPGESQINLADLEARAKAEKEGPYDPYKSLGIPTFPEYLFGITSVEDRKNLEKLKKD